MNIKYILVVFFFLSLQSCSNKQVYENIQYNKRLECQRLQLPQYESCMEQIGPSYEVYESEKDKLKTK